MPEEKDSACIFFTYQEKRFIAIPKNDSQLIHIFDTVWAHIDLCDIDAFSRLRKAINESNTKYSVTTFYIIVETINKAYIHSKSHIWFVPQIPQIEEHLRMELNEFFCAHLYVGDEIKAKGECEK